MKFSKEKICVRKVNVLTALIKPRLDFHEDSIFGWIFVANLLCQ